MHDHSESMRDFEGFVVKNYCFPQRGMIESLSFLGKLGKFMRIALWSA